MRGCPYCRSELIEKSYIGSKEGVYDWTKELIQKWIQPIEKTQGDYSFSTSDCIHLKTDIFGMIKIFYSN